MENQDLPNKTLRDILTSRGNNGGFGDIKIRRSRDFRFYGITQSRTGTPEHTFALKIIKSDKEQLVIPYHDIGTPIKFDGKGIIEISAASIHLIIEGKGLDKILDYLAEHRLMWIKEPETSEDLFFDNEMDDDENIHDKVIIHSIEVKSVH